MNKGEMRKKILDLCEDEDLERILSDWIDEVESALGEAIDLLDIDDINQLGQIEEARSNLISIHDALY